MKIRRASIEDSYDIWQWRNDPHTRAMSKNSNEVNWEDHSRWYENAISGKYRLILIGVNTNCGEYSSTDCVKYQTSYLTAGEKDCQPPLTSKEPTQELIGMVRFDINPYIESAEISINLNPNWRHKNVSKALLSLAIVTFRNEHKLDLTATIKKVNLSSIKIFKECGFELCDEDKTYFYFTSHH